MENEWKELIPISFIHRKDGYILVKVNEHPYANKKGYVYYHRLIMENYLKRYLKADEVVHHIDENKLNNDISNLMLMTRSEHTNKHLLEKGKNIVVLKCPNCGEIFTLPQNECFLIKPTKYNANFCSRKCSGEFFAKVQFSGMDEDMKKKLSECLIKEQRVYLDHSYKYREKLNIDLDENN